MGLVSENSEYYLIPRKERERRKVIKSAEYAKKLFKDYQSEEGLAIDFRHKWLGDLWITNDDKRKIWHRRPYDAKFFKILIKALIVAGENNCLNKPMDKEEFKEMVAKGDSDIYRGMVNNWLKRHPGRDIFESDGKIKLLYPLKENWGIEN